MNELGLAALGALVATTIFLLAIVVVCARVFFWVKSAGFRFKELQAHQDQNGVRVSSGFSRAEFAEVDKPHALPSIEFVQQLEAPPVKEGRWVEVTSDDDLERGDPLALGDKPGHVRLAMARETAIGLAPARQRVGQRFMMRMLEPAEVIEQAAE